MKVFMMSEMLLYSMTAFLSTQKSDVNIQGFLGYWFGSWGLIIFVGFFTAPSSLKPWLYQKALNLRSFGLFLNIK